DGNRRRQPVDLVHVRLLHHLQELAGIGRQALHITPLALRVDGVECERGFAGARQAGEYDQPVAWDFEIDVLEVVLSGTADRDDTATVKIAAWAVVEKIVHAEFPTSAYRFSQPGPASGDPGAKLVAARRFRQSAYA